MTQLDKNLSEIFDVVPLTETNKPDADVVDTSLTPVVQIDNTTPIEAINPQEIKDQEQAHDDHEMVRRNMIDLVEKGKIAMESALDVVQQSDSPRAFEVFATLLTALSKANQDLNELHMRKQDLKNARSENDTPSKVVNNNAIFVGSTADLNKMLSQMNKTKK